MLTRVKNSEKNDVLDFLNAEPAINVRIAALIKAYGFDMPFFNVWRQDLNAVLARLENSFFIYAGENPDFEEIAFFLSFNPYFHRITGESDTILKIGAILKDGFSCTEYKFMSYAGNHDSSKDETVEIEDSPHLHAVYKVMEAAKSDSFAVPPFIPWYADVSHRIRHGCARAYLLRADNVPVSTCLVSVESESVGMISGVATIPECRRNGYAGVLLNRVCSDLCRSRKTPVLECLPELVPFYISLGFKNSGLVSTLEQIKK